MPIKVLVVDDSALIRKVLSEIIQSDSSLLLVGAAPDAYVAKRMVQEFRPDVITLDIEMPKVDGLRFLEVMMKAVPTPVVMISTLTESGANATLRALELGAVDFMAKPKLGVAQGMNDYAHTIIQKVKAAAKSKLSHPTETRCSKHAAMRYTGTEKLIGIGASTGGTEAIKDVIMHFPKTRLLPLFRSICHQVLRRLTLNVSIVCVKSPLEKRKGESGYYQVMPT